MKKTTKCLTVIFALVIFLTSCEKTFYGEISPYQKELFLFGEFSNPNGNNPQIVMDLQNSSNEISISSTADASITNNRIEMIFPNIRIEDELGTYQIELSDDIITEELREGEWIEDVENSLQAFVAQNLDVVLVLDVSSSLGNDVVLVKQYARDFISTLFSKNPNSRIGVIGFSDEIYSLPLTNNSSSAISFINNLEENKDATKLYEAIDIGLDLIESSTSEGRAMVTFTDGRNNSWSSTDFETPNLVLNRLNSMDINSYTIGLTGKGGVDESTLEKFSVNGLFEFPETTGDLLKVFNKFANSVVSTYLFVYDRNSSPITNPIELRFRIKVKLF
ncbi:VWA domain-containing protein [bacterium]|nr:VWA domain-containing protein [bacterium]